MTALCRPERHAGATAERRCHATSLDYADPAQVLGTLFLNSVLAGVAAQFGGVVADGFGAFQVASAGFGGDPCAAGLLIRLPDGTCNIHPSPEGHQLLADAIATAIGA